MRGPDLQHPFQGVLLPSIIAPDFVVLCRGLATRLPDGAFFCGIAAAKIMGVPLPKRLEEERIVDVGVAAPGFPPSGRGIRGHMLNVGGGGTRDWAGLHITSPEQTWCDLGARLSVLDLVAAADYLIHWETPITTIEQLAFAVGKRSRQRGVIRLRVAVTKLNDRSESPPESKLRVIVTDAGIPGLVANLPITTSGGYNYRADLAFPEWKVIIEYQSAFHENPTSFRKDMTRVSRLEADEWKVMQVNKEDVADPVELVSRIRRVIAHRPSFTATTQR